MTWCRFAMGQQLFAAAPEPKRFYPIEGAGHNNLLEAGGEAYLACLRRFVAESARDTTSVVEASVRS